MTPPFGRLLLASASPRRRDLLAQAGFACEVCPSDVTETPFEGERPDAYCARNAREKALGIARARPSECAGAVVLAADTIVVSPHGAILEKPRDAPHASAMLRELSDRTHQVLTGVCVANGTTGAVIHEELVSTRVLFRRLEEAEIEAYVASGEPFDKAGSYGIQGRAAGFVKAIDGSYTNVVGLPLAEVVVRLRTLLGFAGAKPKRGGETP